MTAAADEITNAHLVQESLSLRQSQVVERGAVFDDGSPLHSSFDDDPGALHARPAFQRTTQVVLHDEPVNGSLLTVGRPLA